MINPGFEGSISYVPTPAIVTTLSSTEHPTTPASHDKTTEAGIKSALGLNGSKDVSFASKLIV